MMSYDPILKKKGGSSILIKSFLPIVVCFVFQLTNPILAIESVVATVSGVVELRAIRGKKFPTNLYDIFVGRGRNLPYRKSRRIKVRGGYEGTHDVSVSEKLKVDEGKGRYHFRFPVIDSVIRTLAAKRGREGVSVIDDCYTEFSNSVEKVIYIEDESIVREIFHYSSNISVRKLVAQRKGNRAILSWVFRDINSKVAQGRFRLKFQYE